MANFNAKGFVLNAKRDKYLKSHQGLSELTVRQLKERGWSKTDIKEFIFPELGLTYPENNPKGLTYPLSLIQKRENMEAFRSKQKRKYRF